MLFIDHMIYSFMIRILFKVHRFEMNNIPYLKP